MPVTMRGSPSPPRQPDEMKLWREMIASKQAAHYKQDNAVHHGNLLNMKPTIDDDTEDDATGEARARLRQEAAAKREADEAARKAAAKEYFEMLKQAHTVTDTHSALAQARTRPRGAFSQRTCAPVSAIASLPLCSSPPADRMLRLSRLGVLRSGRGGGGDRTIQDGRRVSGTQAGGGCRDQEGE